MLLACLVVLASGAALSASASPMPYPLPANFSFGNCGSLPGAVIIRGCEVPVTLAAKVSVRCSTQAGCDPGCAKSALAQGVFSRYEARLSGGGAPPPPARAPAAAAAVTSQPPPAVGAAAAEPGSATRFWWVLNNTNCNLHDLRGPNGPKCSAAAGVAACKTACEAHPDCGAFLLSTLKGGGFQLKNSSCWGDIGPLPSSDFGDNLYISENATRGARRTSFL